MPCIYEGCSDPNGQSELMLECGLDPNHTAHLSCWAHYAAANQEPGSEGYCLELLMGSCFGVASHPSHPSPDDVRAMIARRIEELGLHYAHAGSDEPRVEPGTLFYSSDEEASLEPDPRRRRLNQDEPESYTAPAPQPAPQPKVKDCAMCDEKLALNEAGDDYAAGKVFWCSGLAEDRAVGAYCDGCAGEANHCCKACKLYHLAAASMPVIPAPQLIAQAYDYEIPGCLGRGRPQVARLCYAAAAATATLWATGQDISIYDFMHLYLMSDQAPSEGSVAWYRVCYATVSSTPAFTQYTPVQIIENVFLAAPEYSEMIASVVWGWGTPVFPQGVPAVLRQNMDTTELAAAVTGGKVVIKGEGVHWTVIYGLLGNSPQGITAIRIYDPISDGYLAESWPPDGHVDYYVVG